MNEFKKWLGPDECPVECKVCFTGYSGEITPEIGCSICQTLLKTGWIAALEWMVDNEEWIGCDDGGNFGMETWKIIKELEKLKEISDA